MNFRKLLEFTSKIEQNNSLLLEAYSDPGYVYRVINLIKKTNPAHKLTDNELKRVVEAFTETLDGLNAAEKLPKDLQFEKLGRTYQTLRLTDFKGFKEKLISELHKCNITLYYPQTVFNALEKWFSVGKDYGKFEMPPGYVEDSDEGPAKISDGAERVTDSKNILALKDEEINRIEQKISDKKEKLKSQLRSSVPKKTGETQENYNNRIQEIVNRHVGGLTRELEKYNQKKDEPEAAYLSRLSDTLQRVSAESIIRNQVLNKDVYERVAEDFFRVIDSTHEVRAPSVRKCVLYREDTNEFSPEKINYLFSFTVYNKLYTPFVDVNFPRASFIERSGVIRNIVNEINAKLKSENAPVTYDNITKWLNDVLTDRIFLLDVEAIASNNLPHSEYKNVLAESFKRKNIAGPISDLLADIITRDDYRVGRDINMFRVSPNKDIVNSIINFLKLNMTNERFVELNISNIAGIDRNNPQIVVDSDQLLIMVAHSAPAAIKARELIEKITKCGSTGGESGHFRFGWCISASTNCAFNYYRYTSNYTIYFVVKKIEYYNQKYKGDYCSDKTAIHVVQQRPGGYLVTNMNNTGDVTYSNWKDVVSAIPELDAQYKGVPIKDYIKDVPHTGIPLNYNTYKDIPAIIKKYEPLVAEWFGLHTSTYLNVDEFINLKSDYLKRAYVDTRSHYAKSTGGVFNDTISTRTPNVLREINRKVLDTLRNSGNGKYINLIAQRYNTYPNYDFVKIKKGSNEAVKTDAGDISFIKPPKTTIYERLPQSRIYITVAPDSDVGTDQLNYIDEDGNTKPFSQIKDEIYKPTKNELAKEQRPLFDAEIINDIEQAMDLIKFIKSKK